MRYGVETVYSTLNCLNCSFSNYAERRFVGCEFPSIGTDSRSLDAGALFVALRGENFDGHDFVAAAVAAGAGGICVDRADVAREWAETTVVYLVDDTLRALQDLAALRRNKYEGVVIAVTGSVGKTSTRNWIAAALKGGGKVYQTRENLNNQIGTAQMLLDLPDDADFCVLELGMHAAGQIRRLSEMVRPDIAVITNIGWSHIENLDNRENLFRAKTEIITGLKPGGWLVLNGEDELLATWVASEPGLRSAYKIVLVGRRDGRTHSFAGTETEIPLLLVEDVRTEKELSFSVRTVGSVEGFVPLAGEVRVDIIGEHHLANLLLALACAAICGLELPTILSELDTFTLPGSRQEIREIDGITIIDDSYNASFESIHAALAVQKQIAGRARRILVLGTVMELGAFSEQIHYRVGEDIAAMAPDLALVCGADAESVLHGFRDSVDGREETVIRTYSDRESLTADLCSAVREGDVILLKGSNFHKLWLLIEPLSAGAAILRTQEDSDVDL
ncbi:MAG: UDP-N-acetylmuramoyl-tripeptide--D-alanyl-D-alanine ligase [Clostridiaceae bacterium]|nr:UDP-N-acetylmuramoyl-tripeptide--D-alanyl-D-alanine ligase [Clostridiaceae bacterium]